MIGFVCLFLAGLIKKFRTYYHENFLSVFAMVTDDLILGDNPGFFTIVRYLHKNVGQRETKMQCFA